MQPQLIGQCDAMHPPNRIQDDVVHDDDAAADDDDDDDDDDDFFRSWRHKSNSKIMQRTPK